MHGPWRHYAKGDESDKEKHKLYNLAYIWNLLKMNLSKQKTDG